MTIQDFALTPIAPEDAAPVSPQAYFDSSVKYRYDNPHQQGVSTLSVQSLIKAYHESVENVAKVTIPLSVVTRTNPSRGTSFEYPALWDVRSSTQDDNFGRFSSWAIVVADSSLCPIEGSNILKMNWCTKTPKDISTTSRQAQVHVQTGGYLVAARIASNHETYLVYRVVDILPWSAECEFQPTAENPMVLANAELVAVRTKGANTISVREWAPSFKSDRDLYENYTAIIENARQNMLRPELNYAYIEYFNVVQNLDNVKGVDFSFGDISHSFFDLSTDKEHFLSFLYAKLRAYRINLLESASGDRDSRLGSRVTAISAHYLINDSDEVELTVKIPTLIPDVVDNMAIKVVFTDIPESLFAEPSLLLGADTIEDLRTAIETSDSAHISLFSRM